MQSDGFEVETRGVNHRVRKHGRSKYSNFGRLAVAAADMRGVMWLRKRRRSPGGIDEI
jgi:dolichol-phosphate mannosyltransferase